MAEDESAEALRSIALYGLLPFWFVPGVVDYAYHRKTHIERTAGTYESLLHALMMSVAGTPTALALFCEVNSLVIAAASGAAVLHELITFWDVAYADDRRELPPGEQHTHAFLEVIPFVGAGVLAALYPQRALAIVGRGNEAPSWRLEFKRSPLSARYRMGILLAIAAFVVVPYTEELVRCYRHDGTIRPHPPQP